MGDKSWGLKMGKGKKEDTTPSHSSNGKKRRGDEFLSLLKYVFKIIPENKVEFLQVGLREENLKGTKNRKVGKISRAEKNIKTGSLQAAIPYEVIVKGPGGGFSAGHRVWKGKQECGPFLVALGRRTGQNAVKARGSRKI